MTAKVGHYRLCGSSVGDAGPRGKRVDVKEPVPHRVEKHDNQHEAPGFRRQPCHHHLPGGDRSRAADVGSDHGRDRCHQRQHGRHAGREHVVQRIDPLQFRLYSRKISRKKQIFLHVNKRKAEVFVHEVNASAAYAAVHISNRLLSYCDQLTSPFSCTYGFSQNRQKNQQNQRRRSHFRKNGTNGHENDEDDKRRQHLHRLDGQGDGVTETSRLRKMQ